MVVRQGRACFFPFRIGNIERFARFTIPKWRASATSAGGGMWPRRRWPCCATSLAFLVLHTALCGIRHAYRWPPDFASISARRVVIYFGIAYLSGFGVGQTPLSRSLGWAVRRCDRFGGVLSGVWVGRGERGWPLIYSDGPGPREGVKRRDGNERGFAAAVESGGVMGPVRAK
jgi:hypothetical protein